MVNSLKIYQILSQEYFINECTNAAVNKQQNMVNKQQVKLQKKGTNARNQVIDTRTAYKNGPTAYNVEELTRYMIAKVEL